MSAGRVCAACLAAEGGPVFLHRPCEGYVFAEGRPVPCGCLVCAPVGPVPELVPARPRRRSTGRRR